jgi:hypothetical protein
MDLEKDNSSLILGFKNQGRAIPGRGRGQFIAAYRASSMGG